MDMTDYQAMAQRTSGDGRTASDKIDNGVIGLCGESGECADILKKHRHQGHPFDRAAMIEELGDVLWYCAELATGLAVDLGDVAAQNITKLRRRYPDGFDTRHSIDRTDERPL